MVKNYREENYHTNEVVIRDLLTKHSLWANQAYELLYCFKEQAVYQRVLEHVFPKIRDNHNKYKLIEHFKWEMQTMLTRIKSNLGQAMNFNFWNPQGHYVLNLKVPEQREVANTILLLNKQFFVKVKAGELKDRSQHGNASCLRNEKVAGGAIIWTPDYVLPKMGNFECDFIYMVPNRPKLSEATGEQDIMLLLAWF